MGGYKELERKDGRIQRSRKEGCVCVQCVCLCVLSVSVHSK